jgi:hypothetical protein
VKILHTGLSRSASALLSMESQSVEEVLMDSHEVAVKILHRALDFTGKALL